MKLLEVKNILKELNSLNFKLPNGTWVPSHFHVTEVGKISKHYIDCGGTIRNEEVVSFQLWNADDYDHRLHPEKLLKIIELSEKELGINNQLEVEVEYQGKSIEKYGLSFENRHFILTTKHTDCLAKENCGIPNKKKKINLSELQNNSCCSPNSTCC